MPYYGYPDETNVTHISDYLNCKKKPDMDDIAYLYITLKSHPILFNNLISKHRIPEHYLLDTLTIVAFSSHMRSNIFAKVQSKQVEYACRSLRIKDAYPICVLLNESLEALCNDGIIYSKTMKTIKKWAVNLDLVLSKLKLRTHELAILPEGQKTGRIKRALNFMRSNRTEFVTLERLSILYKKAFTKEADQLNVKE